MSDGVVQVPPDSSGKKVDTSELTVSAQTVERQRVVLADNTAASGLAAVSASAPPGTAYALAVRPVAVPALISPFRGPMGATSGQVLFTEDHSDGFSAGMFNDGCGSASIDHDIRLNGRPTIKLDPQGHTTSSSANSVTLTLGGSPQTIGAATNATLVTTSTSTPSPGVDTGGGYIVFNTPSSSGSWQTTSGNSAVLTYTSAVITGGAGAWTVTFSNVNLLILPGSPDTTIVTNNIGTAVCVANNPNPNPGNSPNTSGVVWKRRIDDQYSGPYGNSVWLHPTGQSSASSNTTILSVSLYNRDGANFTACRLGWQFAIGMNQTAAWNNDNTLLWYLDNAAPFGAQQRFVPFAFETRAASSQHSWDPVNGSWDRAGVWHFAKLVTDFNLQQIVSIQVDEKVYTSMAGRPMYSAAASGAKTMHFSVELGQTTSTRRWWNAGPVVGTAEY